MFVELTGTRQENIEESVDFSKPFWNSSQRVH